MKAAHQGVPIAALPGSQAGGLFSNFAQAASQASTPVSNAPLPASGAARPAPTRASVRPQAASGLDGWLMDRLFGR
jgi:penicillin-binding protein 1A